MELGERIEIAINKAIEGIHPDALYQKPSKLKLYIPKYCINILVDYLNIKFAISSPGKHFYKGLEIVEGYELSIILAHEDYPIHNDAGFISKVEI